MWKIQDIVSGQKGFQGFFKESAWLSSGLAVGSKRGIILVPRWPRLRILMLYDDLFSLVFVGKL